MTALRLAVVCLVSAAVSAPFAQERQAATPQGPPSGIFLERAGADPLKIASSMTMDVDMQGIGASAATFGIVKPAQIVRHSGATAEVVVTSAQPSFLFRFPPPVDMRGPNAGYQMMAAMSEDGLPFMSTHPKEFMLVMMTVEGDMRILNSKKVTKGKYDIKNVGPREFRVTVSQPLMPGEWAFFLADQRKGGGTPTQIWAFSWRPEGE